MTVPKKERSTRRTPTARKSKVPVTAADWNTSLQKTKMVTLPSGITIEMKELDLLSQAATGHISLPILSSVVTLADKFESPSEWSDIKEDDMKKLLDTFRSVAIHAVVSPRLSNDGLTDTVDVNLIETTDLMYIFSSAIVGGNALNLAALFQKPRNDSES